MLRRPSGARAESVGEVTLVLGACLLAVVVTELFLRLTFG